MQILYRQQRETFVVGDKQNSSCFIKITSEDLQMNRTIKTKTKKIWNREDNVLKKKEKKIF